MRYDEVIEGTVTGRRLATDGEEWVRCRTSEDVVWMIGNAIDPLTVGERIIAVGHEIWHDRVLQYRAMLVADCEVVGTPTLHTIRPTELEW